MKKRKILGLLMSFMLAATFCFSSLQVCAEGETAEQQSEGLGLCATHALLGTVGAGLFLSLLRKQKQQVVVDTEPFDGDAFRVFLQMGDGSWNPATPEQAAAEANAAFTLWNHFKEGLTRNLKQNLIAAGATAAEWVWPDEWFAHKLEEFLSGWRPSWRARGIEEGSPEWLANEKWAEGEVAQYWGSHEGLVRNAEDHRFQLEWEQEEATMSPADGGGRPLSPSAAAKLLYLWIRNGCFWAFWYGE
jgi:hypothetical protein